MFIYVKVGISKFAEMHGDRSDFYQSTSKSDSDTRCRVKNVIYL
jgi:hypothetical protein